jgi:CheY-like chemotaxis protein
MSKQGVILIAEDNETDALMIQRAFTKAKLLNPIRVVPDGAEAIAYLAGEGKYANRSLYPLPELMLLDLKMPNKNGLEVLEWLQQQPELRGGLRVVVLTASNQAQDVNRAYQLGANSFLVKPVGFEQFVQISQALKGYWLWLSKTPELPVTDHKSTDLQPNQQARAA